MPFPRGKGDNACPLTLDDGIIANNKLPVPVRIVFAAVTRLFWAIVNLMQVSVIPNVNKYRLIGNAPIVRPFRLR